MVERGAVGVCEGVAEFTPSWIEPGTSGAT